MTTGQAEPWTVLRLLEWTTQFFKKRGFESPRLDAEVLLAEARGSSRIDLYTAFNQEPTPEVREAFRELVRRRGEGTPVAYLVGHKEFYSLDLRVSEATLIPRPETEHVVIEALDQAKAWRAAGRATERPLRIVDCCTGSGAIAVAIAKNLPECEVTATDLSPEALEIASYNIHQHQLDDRVRAVVGDLLEPIPAEPAIDIICSNPPYVSQSEYDALAAEVREHEPQMALLAGPRGTEVIERLVAEAAVRLVPGGRLILELSPMIADASQQLVEQHGGYEATKFIKDLAGHRRVLSTTRAE
ncbi:peptide chain release factor N(5)-glutamine methyltransferase [Candidatus Laterigemmans baculatus]|uniref:peptide chain release factor N(5)-glutamine methyltransferase n=1 Tax=Candidatus Laterigemmans baculatus TaxID=2770505 RepID=UPI0013DC5F8D|nr:peptide chain release factor N(5)-glutamine methyltransferase [Candidatus Laterigemmans baculatus]